VIQIDILDANRLRSHRRLISPHPVASSSTNPPPVPQVPARYAGQTSWIFSRRNTPTYHSPPISANSEPFAFEQSPESLIAGPSNLQRRAELQPTGAAPRSQHVPALGFGGALLSSNRVQPVQRARMAAAAQINRRRAPQVRNVRNFNAADLFFNDNDEEALQHINAILGFYDHDFSRYRGHLQSIREREQYQQHYTHPPAPEPGFTFDFAPPSPEDDNGSQNVSRSGTPRFFPPTSIEEPIILDDDDDDDCKHKQSPKGKEKERAVDSSSQQHTSSSHNSKKLKALLVCANCLDPLVLNAGLAPEEAENRRVWGLRCGHLIDEKCLNKLGKPGEVNSGDEDQVEFSVEKSRDSKGKGKAKAASDDVTTSPSNATNGYPAVPEVPPPQPQPEVPADTSIRSRLRSRLSAAFLPLSSTAVASTTALNAAAAEPESALATNLSPPTKRRRGPNKRQSKKVQEMFEWKCPVATCGRVHISVKVNGIWGPERERSAKGVKGLQTEARGAVPVFA